MQKNAAMERREASALRHWARRASQAWLMVRRSALRPPRIIREGKRRPASPAPAQKYGWRSVGLAQNKNQMSGIRKNQMSMMRNLRAAHSLYPPPCGEGRRASRESEMRDGVGVDVCAHSNSDPHPAASLTLGVDPPHKGEGKKERAVSGMTKERTSE